METNKVAVEPVGVQAQFWSLLEASQEHWLGSFLLNLLGYALIIVPAGLLIRRWKKDPTIKRGKNMIARFVNYMCTYFLQVADNFWTLEILVLSGKWWNTV